MFPIYTGKLLDAFEAKGNASAGYAILFAICGSAYLVAFAMNHLLAPRFEPIDDRRPPELALTATLRQLTVRGSAGGDLRFAGLVGSMNSSTRRLWARAASLSALSAGSVSA